MCPISQLCIFFALSKSVVAFLHIFFTIESIVAPSPPLNCVLSVVVDSPPLWPYLIRSLAPLSGGSGAYDNSISAFSTLSSSQSMFMPFRK